MIRLLLLGLLVGFLSLVVLVAWRVFRFFRWLSHPFHRERRPEEEPEKNGGPTLEARACPYCGEFVSRPPQLDESGTCDICHRQVQKKK